MITHRRCEALPGAGANYRWILSNPRVAFLRGRCYTATERLHMSEDRIVKTIVLRAPRDRVWRALTDSSEFGSWFGMKLDGPFVPGAQVRGVIVPTTVDDSVAAAQKEYEGFPVEIFIEKIEPKRLFSIRWHPYAVDRKVDYTAEPTTLVEFVLDDAPGGIMLTVSESGFERIPLARRAKAFTANEQGWTMVVTLIEKFIADAP
jgi:uncharacterized protein YndB with AHSA1/START domain